MNKFILSTLSLLSFISYASAGTITYSTHDLDEKIKSLIIYAGRQGILPIRLTDLPVTPGPHDKAITDGKYTNISVGAAPYGRAVACLKSPGGEKLQDIDLTEGKTLELDIGFDRSSGKITCVQFGGFKK